MSEAPTQTPLDSMDETSLEALMTTDPLKLTRVQLDKIVADLRQQRMGWLADEQAKQSAPKKSEKSAAKAAKKAEAESFLSDLGF